MEYVAGWVEWRVDARVNERGAQVIMNRGVVTQKKFTVPLQESSYHPLILVNSK